jgi:hypothetical protein
MLSCFAQEVSAMLRNDDRVGEVVNEFVRDLRIVVRQTVVFEFGPVNVPIFDAVHVQTAEFRDVMVAADRLRPRQRVEAVEVLREVRASITAESLGLRGGFESLVDELRDEFADLHRLRTNVRKKRRDREQQASAIARRMSELEADEIVHRAEVGMFEKARRGIENGKKREDESGELRGELRDVCNYLRRFRHRTINPIPFLKRRSLEIVEKVEEVQLMRSAYERAQSLFSQTLESLSFSLNKSRWMRSMPAVTQHNDLTRTEVSLGDVRLKFDNIQKERDRALEDWSVFLDDLARNYRVGSARKRKR